MVVCVSSIHGQVPTPLCGSGSVDAAVALSASSSGAVRPLDAVATSEPAAFSADSLGAVRPLDAVAASHSVALPASSLGAALAPAVVPAVTPATLADYLSGAADFSSNFDRSEKVKRESFSPVHLKVEQKLQDWREYENLFNL